MAAFARTCSTIVLLGATLASTGCVDDKALDSIATTIRASSTQRPDELPVMQGSSPFHYPAELYTERVQGNVTLSIFIDTLGVVHPESTRVVESSGHAPLDSAAVKGTQSLLFTPAKLAGKPMAVSILFPVYYRHPDEPPLPGDTILRRPAPATPAPTP